MDEPAPNHVVVPTSDPGATEAEYRAKGWFVGNCYAGKFYPTLCDGHLWAVSFWRPAQTELLMKLSVQKEFFS